MASIYRHSVGRSSGHRFNFVRLGETFATTYDPATEIDAFGRSLLRAAGRRLDEIGASPSDDLSFALDALHPARVIGISTYVEPSCVSSRILSEYLRMLLTNAEARVDVAADGDAVAEAVIQALDDLHAYVLAHRLVPDAFREEYLEAERRMIARFERPPRDDPRETVAREQTPEAAPSEMNLRARGVIREWRRRSHFKTSRCSPASSRSARRRQTLTRMESGENATAEVRQPEHTVDIDEGAAASGESNSTACVFDSPYTTPTKTT